MRTPESLARVAELAAAGRSDTQIGRALGMSASGVFKIRRAAGIPSRTSRSEVRVSVICPTCHAPVSAARYGYGIDPHMRLTQRRIRGIYMAVPCEMSMELVS